MSNITPFLRAPTPDDPSSIGYEGKPPGWQPPATPQSTGLDRYQQDSLAYLKSVLDYYGLGSLSDWAWEQIVKGNSPDQVMQELRQRPEFKQRFPVIDARRAAGLSPMSVDEILAYEKQARWILHSAGLPAGFMDSNAAIQSFMSQDVSLSELSQRIQLAAEDMYSTDSVLRDQLSTLYNLTPGEHLAYILDPKTALPIIQRRWLSASLSATAVRAQFGGLSQSEAEELAGIGVTTSQAREGFNTLASQRGLFSPLPSEVADQITRAEQIGAAFMGDAAAQERIARRRGARVAEYSQGGGYAASQGGIVGLGEQRT